MSEHPRGSPAWWQQALDEAEKIFKHLRDDLRAQMVQLSSTNIALLGLEAHLRALHEELIPRLIEEAPPPTTDPPPSGN